jgi:hypothetical protein
MKEAAVAFMLLTLCAVFVGGIELFKYRQGINQLAEIYAQR